MWILWDVYNGYHGIYCPICWGIGGFFGSEKSELVLNGAPAEDHLFLYNIFNINL